MLNDIGPSTTPFDATPAELRKQSRHTLLVWFHRQSQRPPTSQGTLGWSTSDNQRGCSAPRLRSHRTGGTRTPTRTVPAGSSRAFIALNRCGPTKMMCKTTCGHPTRGLTSVKPSFTRRVASPHRSSTIRSAKTLLSPLTSVSGLVRKRHTLLFRAITLTTQRAVSGLVLKRHTLLPPVITHKALLPQKRRHMLLQLNRPRLWPESRSQRSGH